MTRKTVTSFVLALCTAVLLFATAGWAADDKDKSDIETLFSATFTV